MRQPSEFINGDDSLEDGMIAPGIPLSVTQHENAQLSMSERPSSASQTQDVLHATGTTMENSSTAQYTPLANEKALANIGACPQEEENGICFNGHAQSFFKHAENGSIIEDPKTEMEGFIMREHDIDVIREPVAEFSPLVKEAPDDHRNLQPSIASNQGSDVIAYESSAPQKRRVQWIDNFGKELVQVLEYEASDTGESEEDDDDADAHACTCTIQ